MINHPLLKVNDELFIIKKILDVSYESLGTEWNALSPLNKTFKKDNKVFFCELIEEIEFAIEDVENLTI